MSHVDLRDRELVKNAHLFSDGDQDPLDCLDGIPNISPSPEELNPLKFVQDGLATKNKIMQIARRRSHLNILLERKFLRKAKR